MKIISVELNNTKKLKAVTLNPDGRNVEIVGPSGVGKTTAVSALWHIISGGKDLLQTGQKKGFIKVKLSDGKRTILAERTFTPSRSLISLKDQDGKEVSIKDFKDMISDLAINPHRLMSLPPRERVKALLAAADLGGEDLTALDEEIAKLEEARLEAKRKLELMKAGPEPEKVEPVDIASVAEQRSELLLKAAARKSLVDEGKRRWSEQKEVEAEIVEIKARLASAENRLQKAQEAVREKSEQFAVVKGEDYSTDALDARLAEAGAINAKAQVHAEWTRQKQKEEKQKAVHAKIDDEVKTRREHRAEVLVKAKWPLPGLEVQDSDIFYNGIHIDALGESEQQLCCAAIVVQDVRNHAVHAIRMDGIESLSLSDWNKLKELYNGFDVQILSTRVTRGDIEDGEIVIEDGVYGVEPEAKEEAPAPEEKYPEPDVSDDHFPEAPSTDDLPEETPFG